SNAPDGYGGVNPHRPRFRRAAWAAALPDRDRAPVSDRSPFAPSTSPSGHLRAVSAPLPALHMPSPTFDQCVAGGDIVVERRHFAAVIEQRRGSHPRLG